MILLALYRGGKTRRHRLFTKALPAVSQTHTLSTQETGHEVWVGLETLVSTDVSSSTFETERWPVVGGDMHPVVRNESIHFT